MTRSSTSSQVGAPRGLWERLRAAVRRRRRRSRQPEPRRLVPPLESPSAQEQPHHLSTFRYAEALLLFHRVAGPPDGDHFDLDRVKEALKEWDVDPNTAFLRRGGRATDREITLTRGTQAKDQARPDLKLLKVNLPGWDPEIERKNSWPLYHHILEPALKVVPEYVARFNGQNAAFDQGNWRLLWATPHWRASAFCGDGGGGPGGRLVRARTTRSFRPFGGDVAVRKQVADCLGIAVGDLQSDVRGKIRVAVLDSWPMANEPELACGERPARPLDKLRIYLANHPSAWGNNRLIRAARGDLVHPRHFRDYVSWDPDPGFPLRHHNWDQGTYDPAYDMSDHGLFVADIIKDIAPDAEIHLYRVLNDQGTADLSTVVRALEDAITDAAGQPLIINLSLGFVPPLRLASLVTANGQAAVEEQYPGRWRERVHERASNEGGPAGPLPKETQALANEQIVLVNAGKVVSLQGMREVFDYLFRLPDELRVLAVAAAGNDSNGVTQRFGPRLPAFVEGVLGVSARDAQYSNRDDPDHDRDDGVAAFGGQAANVGGLMRTTEGIIGPAITGDRLPNPAGEYPIDGWVEWAGTSFATPVSTAVAACVWAERLARGEQPAPQQILRDVVGPPAAAGHREIELRQADSP